MSGRYREVEHRYMGRKRAPHCRTCVCRQKVDIPIRINISSPKMEEFRARCSPRKTRECCGSCHLSPSDEWITRDEFRGRYNISPTIKTVRKLHNNDHKMSVLETWFKRFDFDGNGLMDVYELKNLLNHLGIKCEQEYVKELIEEADRDRDGMLSFSDFLYMWSRAAQEDGDLSVVVKQYDIYPDILPSPKHHYRRNLHMDEENMHTYKPRLKCSCGDNRLIKAYRTGSKRRDVDIQMEIPRSPTSGSDELPVLSCHR